MRSVCSTRKNVWGHDCVMIESQYTSEPAFGNGGGGDWR